MMVGVDHINYPSDCDTPMDNVLTEKILLNRMISMVSAEFMSIDINNFYANTLLIQFEYLRLNWIHSRKMTSNNTN